MNRFAELLDRLAYEPGRNNKLRLITKYFREVEDPDRGYARRAAGQVDGARGGTRQPGLACNPVGAVGARPDVAASVKATAGRAARPPLHAAPTAPARKNGGSTQAETYLKRVVAGYKLK